MGYSRDYTCWYDNSDRTDYFDKYGNKETTHVDRTDWSGNYKCTDVYDKYDRKIDTFVKG